jgi:hypothetical protein
VIVEEFIEIMVSTTNKQALDMAQAGLDALVDMAQAGLDALVDLMLFRIDDSTIFPAKDVFVVRLWSARKHQILTSSSASQT